jgi:hypothetical protein
MQKAALVYIQNNQGCGFTDIIEELELSGFNRFEAFYAPSQLEATGLAKRVFTEYPNPTVPELHLGNLQYFTIDGLE